MTPRPDWSTAIGGLGPRIAARAAEHDASDSFVVDNLTELKAIGVLGAGIPVELGGGGASNTELSDLLRLLARSCGATALTLSIHTHLVAALVWRWRGDPEPVECLLRRVAGERLLLVSTGASDWLTGSGTAERWEQGWRISGRKRFCSGIPMGDCLITSAIWDNNGAPTVLHFPLWVRENGIRILETWRVLGMRGTGSHDVLLEDAYVPDANILLRRPQGRWHPAIHVSVLLGLPLIFSVYMGIAEAAYDLALECARSRGNNLEIYGPVGEMANELMAARIAHADMVAAAAACEPSETTTNRIMTGRMLVGQAVIRTVEKAMQAAGGSGLYRSVGLERHFRDIQGARYHSPQEHTQRHYAGRIALGLGLED